jgi:3-hydroxybutyryl-CoA dehydrogenase
MTQSKHIAVLGAGLMGYEIAQLFAAKGHEVTLFEQDGSILEKVIGLIESNLAFLSAKGLNPGLDINSTIDRVKLSTNLEEAITDARFVVETLEEDLEIKQSIFEEMEQYCSPVTVLATSTLQFRISEIIANMKVKERVVGIYFWPPLCLIPLVEVMGSQNTLPEVKDYVSNLILSMGVRPVMINSEGPGFIGPRLNQALRREALSIVDHGLTDLATVDEVIRIGLCVSLAALGLIDNVDMTGVAPLSSPHELSGISSLSFSGLAPYGAAEEERLVSQSTFCSDVKNSFGNCQTELVRQLINWNREKYRGLNRQ